MVSFPFLWGAGESAEPASSERHQCPNRSLQWEWGWCRIWHFCSCRWFSHFGATARGLVSRAAWTRRRWKSPFCSWGSGESCEPGQDSTSRQINGDRGTGHWSIHCFSRSLKVGQGGFGKPSVLRPPLWSVKLFVSRKCLYSFPEGEVLTCCLSFPQPVPPWRRAVLLWVPQGCSSVMSEPRRRPYLPDPLLGSSPGREGKGAREV